MYLLFLCIDPNIISFLDLAWYVTEVFQFATLDSNRRFVEHFSWSLMYAVSDDGEFQSWAVADGDRLSMDKDVHPRFACQLETRTWCITDDYGEVETVKGPGVVGTYNCYLLCLRRDSLWCSFSRYTADTFYFVSNQAVFHCHCTHCKIGVVWKIRESEEMETGLVNVGNTQKFHKKSQKCLGNGVSWTTVLGLLTSENYTKQFYKV